MGYADSYEYLKAAEDSYSGGSDDRDDPVLGLRLQ